MSQEPPEGISTGQDPDQPKALFDPYTGQRLEPITDNSVVSDKTYRAATEAAPPQKPTPEHKNRRGTALVAVAALIALVIIGGAIWYINGPRAEARAKESAQAAATAATKAEAKRKAACEGLLTDAYRQLGFIDSRLNVGMVEQDYTEAVGNAQAAYDQIDSGKVSDNRCAAYAGLGKAVNQYSRASSYWNNCIVGDYCTPSETTLNNYWGRSTELLGTIKTNGLGQSDGKES
jgi:hypothetical protein